MTTDVVARLVADLAAEKAELATLLAGCTEADWSVPTPAPGWTVRDQIAHLAHFDGVTRTAIADPDAFVRMRDAVADLQGYVDGVGAANAHRAGRDLLAGWDAENAALRSAALAVDPATRIPWFGPPMSLASKLTARIMETWAHGQDVVDALGLERRGSARLEHVARIGVLALPNTFRTRNQAVPDRPVRVELRAPDGVTSWAWGPQDTPDRVSGTALDFCLVVTRRRHLADTALVVRGAVAPSCRQELVRMTSCWVARVIAT